MRGCIVMIFAKTSFCHCVFLGWLFVATLSSATVLLQMGRPESVLQWPDSEWGRPN